MVKQAPPETLLLGTPGAILGAPPGAPPPGASGARALSTGVGSIMYIVMELALHLAQV